MQVLQHLRPRLILLSRITMWAVISLLLMIGLFYNSPAWAETATCTGNSSIPVTPITLFLRYAGPPSTYTVTLCGDPAPGDGVLITTTVTPAGKISVVPNTFTLEDTTPMTIAVSVLATHPADEPFTALITHTAASNNPGFNGITTRVTAYYSPPVAISDTTTALYGQSITVTVLANDIDRLGLGISLTVDSIVTGPSHGAASVNTTTQTIQYTPFTGYFGVDSFTYRVVDAIGNTDINTVTVGVAAPGVTSPQIVEIDPAQGQEVIFTTSFGNVEVDLPPLTGVQPGSDVFCIFGELLTPTGNFNTPPVPGSKYSGIAFYLQCFVNGVPITEDMLTGPVTIKVPFSEGFLQANDTADFFIAFWDGTAWLFHGIDVKKTDEGIILSTTHLGEFDVFITRALYLPELKRQ